MGMRGSTVIVGSAVADGIFSYSTANGGTVTVGTAAYPVAVMQMSKANAQFVVGQNVPASGAQLVVTGSAANIDAYRYGNRAAMNLYLVNGTEAAPTAVVNGNLLGIYNAGGYDGTTYGNIGTSIAGQAIENWAAGAHGARLVFYTTAALGTTNTARWYMSQDGHFIAVTDNLYDIGSSGANRPRNLNLAGSVVVAGGGTFATSVTIGAGAAADTQLQISAAAGQNRSILFSTNLSGRWIVRVDGTAESGGDAGSQFQVVARTDAAALIDTPVVIARQAGGAITLGGSTNRQIVISGSGWGAGNASLRLNGLTNGAGGSVGTLNNAPSAGDPNFWIPISIAGTVRMVPSW